jgi:hypothetical protein
MSLPSKPLPTQRPSSPVSSLIVTYAYQLALLNSHGIICGAFERKVDGLHAVVDGLRRDHWEGVLAFQSTSLGNVRMS